MRTWLRVVGAVLTVGLGLVGLTAGPAAADGPRLTGVVTDATGAPIAGARVMCILGPNSWVSLYTDAQGGYRLSASDFSGRRCYALAFVDPTGANALQYYPGTPYRDASTPVDLGVNGATVTVNATLSRATTLTGRIVDAQSRPLPFVTVDAYLGQTPHTDTLYQALTGPDGSFTISGVSAGRYRVRALDTRIAAGVPALVNYSQRVLTGYGSVFTKAVTGSAGNTTWTGTTVMPAWATLFSSAPPPFISWAGIADPVPGTILWCRPDGSSVPTADTTRVYWFAQGAVVGEGSTYQIHRQDVGRAVWCVVVLSRSGYASVASNNPITINAVAS